MLFELGVDGRDRFISGFVGPGSLGSGLFKFDDVRPGDVRLGDDDIIVSTRGDSSSAVKLSLLSIDRPHLT